MSSCTSFPSPFWLFSIFSSTKKSGEHLRSGLALQGKTDILQTERQTDRLQTDRETDRHTTERQTDILQSDRQTYYRQTDRNVIDRRTYYRQTDRNVIDRQTYYRQRDRQTERLRLFDVEEPGEGAGTGHDALLRGGGLLLLQPAGLGGQHIGGRILTIKEASDT